MMGNNLSMTTEMPTADLVKKLTENRAEHVSIVEESRKGFREKAVIALQGALAQLIDGQVVDLNFRLFPPHDQTSQYDTAIEMLTANLQKTVILTSTEFRNLVMDEWDWSDNFLISNRVYSAKASQMSTEKGL